MRSHLTPVTFVISMLIFTLALQACAAGGVQPTSTPLSPTQAPLASPTPPVETPVCIEKLVPPNITEVQPSPVLPGSEITVMARGGYLENSCGGVNESARSFQLYLDKEPVDDLQCYVNHCEAKIKLEDSITLEEHCLSTQPSLCEFRFRVGIE